jgi:hypothetical protein
MVRPGLNCVLWGHEDTVRREPGRVYLECFDCGRTTEGWQLTHEPARPPAAHPERTTSLWATLRTWMIPSRVPLAMLRFNSR